MAKRDAERFEIIEGESAEVPEQAGAGEHLPPVKPPSAGFIVQLFLVPAIIVLVIAGIIITVNTLVSGSQDWQSLVAELRSSNEHRRWRAAHGLAQMLQYDAKRGTEGEHLSHNSLIANELAAMTKEQLDKHSDREDDRSQLAFLTLTLGYLDSQDVVLPVLTSALQPDQDREVRKNAIASLAQISDRCAKEGRTLDEASLTPEVIKASGDGDPLIRQMSAYLLGLFHEKDSADRLGVLLQDGDADTRLNAAIALARRKSPGGYPVFVEILKNGNKVFESEQMQRDALAKSNPTVEEKKRTLQDWKQLAAALEFEQLLSVSNSLKAVKDIAKGLNETQRNELKQLIEPLTANHSQPRIRVEGQDALHALDGTASK